MATFTGSVKVTVQGTLTGSVDLCSLSQNLSYSKSYTISNGTGADAANMMWVDTRTLTASSTENLDLAGSLTDAFGGTITFTKISGIVISAAAANTNNVLVGGAASNAFVNWVSDSTDKLVVRPGGTLCLMANDATGYAVTAATGDILKMANSSSGTSVTYDIIIIGAV